MLGECAQRRIISSWVSYLELECTGDFGWGDDEVECGRSQNRTRGT